MKKGQVSTELMVIVGLVLLIFIPLLVMVYFKAGQANDQIASYQSELAVFRLAYLANSVGSLGTNTSITTDVFIPANTRSFDVNSTGRGGEISMTVLTPQGPSDIVEVVQYPVIAASLLDTSTPGSWMRIKVSSVYNRGVATVDIEKVQ